MRIRFWFDADSFEDKRRGGFSFPESLLWLGVQEEDDSGSARAAAGPRWVATRAKGKPHRAAHFGWGRPLQLGRAGLRRGEGKGVLAGPGSAFSRVSAHSQFCYLKFLFFFHICL
jgi:hypothetical protein